MVPYALAFICVIGLSLAQECPIGTVAYGTGDKTDSCYLFISRHVTWHWWNKFKGFEHPGDTPLEKKPGSSMESVWSVYQAREICQTFHELTDVINVNETKDWKELAKEVRKMNGYFRLPIIEGRHENEWLYEQMNKNTSKFGYSFWIDLEYDADTEKKFWASRGEEFVPADDLDPDPQSQDWRWEEDFVKMDDDDGMVRLCYVFMIAHDGQPGYKGWHTRACAQAYSTTTPYEHCGKYAMVLSLVIGIDPHVSAHKDVFQRQHAPKSVICEMPMIEENKATSPLGYPATRRGGPMPATRRPKRKRKCTSRKYSSPIIVVAFVIANIMLA